MATNFTISAVIKAVDKITGPVGAISRRLTALTAPIGRVRSGLQRITQDPDFRRITGAIKNLGAVALNAALNIAKMSAALLAIASAAAVSSFFAITKGFADAGDEAATTATKLGITTQELQKMRFAADMLDVSNETLDQGMGKLSRSIVMASKGAKDQVKALRLLGYTEKQIRSGKISVTEATTKLAARMEDETKAKSNAIIANTLFGISYLEMMPMLKAGGGAIAELAAEAERLGLVMDEQAIKSAEQYDDANKRLRYSLMGVRNAIGSHLIPLLNPLINGLKDWIVANRELIAQKFTDFILALSAALKDINWRAVLDGISTLANGLAKLVEHINVVKWALIAFATMAVAPGIFAVLNLAKAIALPLVAAIGNFIIGIRAGMGVMGAFNAVMAANPIGLLVIGITALIAALTYAIMKLHEIKEVTGSWIEAFKVALTGLGALIAETLLAPLQGVLKILESAFNLFGNAPDWLKKSANFSVSDYFSNKMAEGMGPNAGTANTSGLRNPAAAQTNKAEANVVVDFKNAPKGTRVESDVKGKGMNLGVDVGYQTGGAI